jgi:DNA-binding response OmpR family regulator
MSSVLLIEPNLMLARQYKSYLEARGHRVRVCEDAQRGIMAADESKPLAVIVELLLAGHSGIEFLYEFRSYAEWKQIPIIVFTSLAPHEIDMPPRQLAELGVSACLYKAETSLARLNTVLQRALKPASKPA